MPTATVDSVTHLLGDWRPVTGEFKLLNDVNASSTLQVSFDFHVVDRYVPDDHRAIVTSTSDGRGEWVGMAEVMGEASAAPSPTSGLFRGQVRLSADVAASASGDGAVWAQPGDSLMVAYFGQAGGVATANHRIGVVAAPQAVPAAGWVALALLGAALGLAYMAYKPTP